MTTQPNVKDVSLFGDNVDASRNLVLSSSLVSTYGWLLWSPGPGGHIDNHVERTIALLIEQFRVERPKINSLVSSVAASCQEVEDVLYDLLRFRAVGYATGKQLDEIGAIVGLTRTSDNDDVYRDDIYFQIYLNKSNGEPETLISALQRVTGAHIDYCEPSPATAILTINQAVKPLPADLLKKMQSLAAAGVKLYVQYNNAVDKFIFNGDVESDSAYPPYYIAGDPYFSAGLGFSELYISDSHTEGGGSLTELITA